MFSVNPFTGSSVGPFYVFLISGGLDHNSGHSLIPAKADIQRWPLDSGFRRNDDPFKNAIPLQYGRRNDQALSGFNRRRTPVTSK